MKLSSLIFLYFLLLLSCKKDNDDIISNKEILIDSVFINDVFIPNSGNLNNVDFTNIELKIKLNTKVDSTLFNKEKLFFTGGIDTFYNHRFNNDSKVLYISPYKSFNALTSYRFLVDQGTNFGGLINNGYSLTFRTCVDSTYKFPIITDEELLTLIQHKTFKYFWDYAHPTSGLARERYSSGEIVTSGGSGFGLMAIPIGIERGFITRTEGIERINKIVDFLTIADRFHGAWSHWLNGSTGKVIPFSNNDNGGDLVETSYMAAGLLCVRQYLNSSDNYENSLITKINTLLNQIEWSWYTKGGEDVLYWHWSPSVGWAMNMQVRGYNEALITYFMAATSSTFPINASVYHKGWARNGSIINGKSFYGITLPVGYDYGGPLFFAHYSFLGLNPKNLHDQYANYWQQNVNHTLINRQHCIINPSKYILHSADCWGLTASDDNIGYGVHEPTRDIGVISPTAALSSMPFTPEESMKAARFFYYVLGDKIWGDYGFYDAFNANAGWWANSYLAIDQGPIVVMIENHRTGLCWNLFMSAPEVQQAMLKIGFSN
ncbi:MAG: glucoamylase family protein [Tenuifilaceae bacterium]